jgi:hypothetical protein
LPAPYRAGKVAYDFCLPLPYADLSLLPEVRHQALGLFLKSGIQWHAGVGIGPSNHLLDSQVQCVNALGQMVHDPARLIRAFGDLLGTTDVLEIEKDRFLTFEYIGPTDFFNEAPGAAERVRGANCTSVDAAFLHKTRDRVELVLLEWKYTERYGKRSPNASGDDTRWKRYGAAWESPRGPVRSDRLAFQHFLDEPFYQLMRQQMLAAALESVEAHGAQRVRVLHVSPAGNLAYQASLSRAEHRALGSNVSEVWHQLLRHGERFEAVDSAMFLDPNITSNEYVRRYANDVAKGETFAH